MTQFASREIMNVTLKNRTTNAPVLSLRTLKVSNLDISASVVDVAGGRGAPILYQFKGSRQIVLDCQDALLSTDFLQIMAGGTASTATTSVPKFEPKVITSTASVTASWTPEGTQSTGIFVFKSSDGATIGSALDYAAVATADTYQLTGTRFSFDPTGSGMATGDNILIDYTYSASAATKTINFNSENFSDYYTLEGETLWRNGDYDYPAIITADKISLDENFSIPGIAEGEPSTFAFKMTCLRPSNSDTTLLQVKILEGDPDS